MKKKGGGRGKKNGKEKRIDRFACGRCIKYGVPMPQYEEIVERIWSGCFCFCTTNERYRNVEGSTYSYLLVIIRNTNEE